MSSGTDDLRRKFFGKLGDGQVNRESTAFAEGAVNGNGATVCLNYMLDDGESQSCATQLAASGLIDPVKPFEQSGEVRRIDTASPILNGNHYF